MYKTTNNEMKLTELMFHDVLDVIVNYQKQGVAQCCAIRALVACAGAVADADTKKLDVIFDILLNPLEFDGEIHTH